MPQGIQLLAGLMAGYALSVKTFVKCLLLLVQFNPPAQIIKTLIVQIGGCEFRSLMLH
jgi:uncharacterized protein YneF (UPF0154 family)